MSSVAVLPTQQSTAEFIQEKRYLLNVSPRTIEWYETSFKWLHRFCPDEVTQGGLNRMVIGMREHGMKPVSCNSCIRVVKTYLNWKGADTLKLGYLKVEQKELRIFQAEEVKKILEFRPRTLNDKRVHTLALVLLDTGLRLEEGLGIPGSNVDLSNLLLTVKGKGNKERKVPISFELRKRLWIYLKDNPGLFVFGTRHGTRLSRRNALRDFKNLCRKAGVVPPPRAIHALRHTFAVNYLRNGGNLFYLARILGHSKVTTTQVYLNAVSTDDLSAVHQQLSILSRHG